MRDCNYRTNKIFFKKSSLLRRKQLSTLYFLLLIFSKSIATDTTKVNVKITFIGTVSKTPIGVYIIDKNGGNNIINFKIISYPYQETFNVNTNTNAAIKIFAQGIDFISDTIYLNITEKNRNYDVSIIAKTREKNIELPLVVIQGKKISNNDTITFKAQKYNTQTTFKTEDLISNIEGFKIDEDGRIFYNNKPISKVLVNGDNLSGDNYTLITKNLSSKTLEEVQVIKNENNNRILANVEKSSDVAINLVLKKQTPKINPNVDFALANKDRYQLNLNALGLFRKLKIFSVYNNNTIAEKFLLKDYDEKANTATPEENAITNNNSTVLQKPYFLNASTISKPLLPVKYIDNNKDNSNINFITYKISKNATLNGEVTHTKNSNVNFANGQEVFTIPNLQEQKISTIKESSLSNKLNKYQIDLDYDSKRKVIIRSYFKYRNVNNASAFIDLTSGAFSDSLVEFVYQKKDEFEVTNYITYKLAKSNVLLLSSKNSFSKIEENLSGKTNRLNSFFNVANREINPIMQNITHALRNNLYTINVINSKKVNYNIGCYLENISFNPNDSIYFQNRFKRNTTDRLNLSQLSTFYKSTIDFSRNYNLYLDGGVGITNFKTDNSNNIFINKFIYGLSTRFQTKEKLKLSVQVSLNIKAHLPEIFSLTNLTYLSNIKQINYASFLNTLLKENSLFIGINKRNLIKGSYSINALFFYNPTSVSSGSTFVNGLFQNQLIIIKDNYGSNLGLNIERYSFLFKSKIFFEANSGYSSVNQLQNNIKANFKILSNSFTLKAVTNFKKFTNFEAQFLYNDNFIKQTNFDNTFTVKNLSYLIKNLYPITKKMMMGNTFKFFKFNNALPIYLHHVSIGYVSKKKNIKAELLLHNVFNYKQFTINQNTFFNQSISSFELVPRYLLLKTSIQF